MRSRGAGVEGPRALRIGRRARRRVLTYPLAGNDSPAPALGTRSRGRRTIPSRPGLCFTYATPRYILDSTSAPSRGGHACFPPQPSPGALYVASPRPYPEKLPPLEYPAHFLAKRVTNAGTFRLKHKLLFIANALKTHHIGLEETGDGVWSIYLGSVRLARVDERDFVLRD